MERSTIGFDNTIFVILSFEGPDPYSFAGGLGARITNLSQVISGIGFPTHLFFIGDPKAKGEETTGQGRLTLHRWGQWISGYYPNGVYHGENDKVNDFNNSIPPFIADQVVKPAIANNKMIVVLSEEWHTAEAVCRLSELLKSQGMRDRVVAFWNANNTFGFDRIDWTRLKKNTTITTVSRYMKHIMRGIGVNPLVIPNGIPEGLLGETDRGLSTRLRQHINSELLFTKVARYDTAKGWDEAIEATARLNQNGIKTTLLARGGIEPYGEEVLYNAKQMGLKVKDTIRTGDSVDDFLNSIDNEDNVDILNHCCPN